MIALPRDSIHQPPGATNVAPSRVARGVSDASRAPDGVVAALTSAPLAGRPEMQKKINSTEIIHRVSIPKNVTIRAYPDKPFPRQDPSSREKIRRDLINTLIHRGVREPN